MPKKTTKSQPKNPPIIKTSYRDMGKTVLGVFLAALIVVFMGGVGLSSVVDSAKPGEPMFIADRSFEKIRVSTSLSSSARFKTKVSIAEERLTELLEFDETDTDSILLSLDELEEALLDVNSELANVVDDPENLKAGNEVIDNLIALVNRYRDFLLDKTEDTEMIQEELDESVDELNNVVDIVNQSNPPLPVPSYQPAPAVPSTPAPAPADKTDECDIEYTNLGIEVEREGQILRKNACGEYSVTTGSTEYVLITNDNLDYAIGNVIKFHGESGTNNSIFITEFEIDD